MIVQKQNDCQPNIELNFGSICHFEIFRTHCVTSLELVMCTPLLNLYAFGHCSYRNLYIRMCVCVCLYRLDGFLWVCASVYSRALYYPWIVAFINTNCAQAGTIAFLFQIGKVGSPRARESTEISNCADIYMRSNEFLCVYSFFRNCWLSASF